MMRDVFDRHKCDKGKRHSYERFYEPRFRPLRHAKLRLLEIGILRGASLAAWVEYFPHAEIVGIDTFGRVPPENVEILGHKRVRWYKHDSTKPLDIGLFDIIIDDGLHTPVSQKATFEAWIDKCRGIYCIEDVWPMDLMTAHEKQHPWLRHKGFGEAEYAELLKTLEPHGPRFHDLRAGYQPDSFIISVRK